MEKDEPKIANSDGVATPAVMEPLGILLKFLPMGCFQRPVCWRNKPQAPGHGENQRFETSGGGNILSHAWRRARTKRGILCDRFQIVFFGLTG
jgi:hypothetical protein